MVGEGVGVSLGVGEANGGIGTSLEEIGGGVSIGDESDGGVTAGDEDTSGDDDGSISIGDET